MDMTSVLCWQSPLLPSLPQQKLFILIGFSPDSQLKKTFHSAAAHLPLAFTMQTYRRVLSNKEKTPHTPKSVNM